ncbi:MAG TPA: phosphopantetheine-binding protein [Pseudonocardiaceae bacterium]|jgi:acyl carrier protein|nr:phosphopantetheine-binding protein [Pseudonocardiaceae bacterium]
MTDLRDRLTTLLVTKFDLAQDDLSSNPTLEDLEFDSLSLVRFETAMENEFGIPFADEELTLDLTVDAVLRLLDQRSA